MYQFKVGDKVNFLNEQGGGTIAKIIDSRMVMVSIEDGFEIPVLASDLVLDARLQPKQEQILKVIQEETQRKADEEAEKNDAARKGGLRRFAKNTEQEGIYLAFVPHEQQWILTGLMDVTLVNHTPADLLYNFNIQQNNSFENIDYGQVSPYQKVVIETISRDDLEYWCNGLIQAILVVEKNDCALMPLHSPFNIRSNRFFKEGSYTMSGVLGEKAIMICLQTLVALKISEEESFKNLKEGFATGESVKDVVKERPLIDKHRTAMGEAVVDLHIGELVENIAGLSSHDMFKIQMDYFNKMLNSALTSDYDKVTFIHGVGNGVLKNAIIKVLNEFEETNKITARMASISKFGVGGIDVIFSSREKN